MRESELRAPVERWLAAEGYRCYFDPDGSDYFDVVAIRGEEVGLVELKVADWRRVHQQALLRRGWGDWTAVVLPRRSLADRVQALKAPPRGDRVGIWYVEEGELRVLRAARPWVGPGETDLFPGLRLHLRETLAKLESGEIPEGVQWWVLQTPLTRGAHRRRMSGKEWKLEEFAAPSAGPARSESEGATEAHDPDGEVARRAGEGGASQSTRPPRRKE